MPKYTTAPGEVPTFEAPPGDLPRKVQVTIHPKEHGAKQLTMGLFFIPPKGHSKLDVHPGVEEAYYILEGTGQVVIGGVRSKLVPGTSVYIPADVEHQSFNESDTDELRFVWFFPRAMKALGHEAQNWPKASEGKRKKGKKGKKGKKNG
jgi:mannose-6-phosphate isomerase-like protein (cupin superfamily)